MENLILDIIADHRNLLQNKDCKKDDVGIEVILANKDKPVFIEADKHRVGQVISNLLINAVKFTKKGRILICLDQKDDPPEVVVI